MPVAECALPSSTAIDRSFIEAAWFHDSYRVPLSRGSMDVVDLFFAIFGFHPPWMKAVLIARHWTVAPFGLDTPSASEVLVVQRAENYKVGDRIGVWPIFAIGESELIVGRDNRHLDFRLSILKESQGDAPSVIVSTVCLVHNVFGKLYLLLIMPFHKWGVRHLLSRAVNAGRL